MIVLLMFIAMLILVFVGIPIAVSLIFTSFIGLWVLLGFSQASEMFVTGPYNILANYTYAVAPLFMLMGNFASASGIVSDAFVSARNWLGNLRGGLLMATIVAGALFGACTGSSIASAALFGRIAYPETQKEGYDSAVSSGAIAVTGTLAMLIPPSIMMVFYGIFTQLSIGSLLIAGVVPGIIVTVFLMVSISIVGAIYPRRMPKPTKMAVSWRERFRSLVAIGPIGIIFIALIGGLYIGFFTPTQAGAIGATITLLTLLIRKRRQLQMRDIWSSLVDASALTAQVYFLILGGFLFSRFVAFSGVLRTMVEWVGNLPIPPVGIMAILVVLYLILGAILDPVSMLVITIPFVYPIVTALGWDGIAFGVIMIILVEMAVITPPIGFNVYAVASAAGIPAGVVFLGVIPFYSVVLVVLWLIILFPEIATFLIR